jgi:hypothetical protein
VYVDILSAAAASALVAALKLASIVG